MRVLHLNAGNLYGGIEVMLCTIARWRASCPELEHSFSVCFEGRYSEELRAIGVPVVNVGEVRTRKPWTIWQARRNFRSVLERGRFDVVISHGAWSHAVLGPVCRELRIPIVLWNHARPSAQRGWLDRWAGRLSPTLAICNSRYTEEGFASLYPEVPRAIVYCPVQPAAKPEATERGTVRRSYDTTDEAVVLLQAGRLDPYKGHRVMLESLAHIADLPNWICWQAAGPQTEQEHAYLAELKALATRLGIAQRVRFLDSPRNYGLLYAAADVFCQPNIEPEHFGIVFIEALYASLPVVASASGGVLEIVTDDCGILTRPSDPQALAGALRRIVSDSGVRQNLGREGPFRARSLCSPETQLKYLYETLQDRVVRN